MKTQVWDKIVKVVLSKTNISATQKENASSAKDVDSCFFCLCNLTNNSYLT